MKRKISIKKSTLPHKNKLSPATGAGMLVQAIYFIGFKGIFHSCLVLPAACLNFRSARPITRSKRSSPPFTLIRQGMGKGLANRLPQINNRLLLPLSVKKQVSPDVFLNFPYYFYPDTCQTAFVQVNRLVHYHLQPSPGRP